MSDEPCITDWLCLPGAHLRFGECVEAPCCDHHAGWEDAPACDDGESDGLFDEES